MRFDENIFYDNHNNPIIKSFHSKVEISKRIYNEHHHTECELSIFLEGSGIYTTNGKTYEFEKGDVFLFGSNEAHCITEIFKPLNLLNIHFEPRILWENPENAELINLFSSRNKKFSNKFSEDEKLKGYILELESEMSNQKEGHKIKVRYALLSALVHIIRNYDYIDISNTINTQTSTASGLKRAINYINDNLEKSITLKEISNTACMSQTYFSYVFKKYNGLSLWEYITIKRVEKAIEMIKTSNMTKLEIAQKCGFSSSSNFYKAFKLVTGKKPKDFSK